MYKVPVYAHDSQAQSGMPVVARVEYNQMLDNWTGNNFERGGAGRHLGLTILRDGTPVLIYGSNWQGSRDYGVCVSEQEAVTAILGTYNADDILANPRFKRLREYAESHLAQEA